MYCPHIVTLYNKLKSVDDVDIFVGTVLNGVFFSTTISRTKEDSDDNAILFIPKNVITSPERSFLQEFEYEAKTEEEKNNFWTLKNGDFFIVGKVILENPKYEDVVERYTSFKITSYEDLSNIGSPEVQHYEVTGK